MKPIDAQDAVAGVAQRVRLTLHAHAAVVAMCDDSAGFRILDADREPAWPSGEIIPRAFMDLAVRTGRASNRTPTPIAVAPVVIEDTVWGVIGVRRDKDVAFSERELEGLEAMALQVADVVEGRPEPEALRRDTLFDALGGDASSVAWADDEATEVEVADGITLAFGDLQPTPFMSVEGLRDLFGNTTQKVLETTGGHVAAIVLGDAEDFRIVALAANPDAPNVPADRLISHTIVNKVLVSGLPLLTLDASRGDTAVPAASVARLSVSTVMCIPLHEGVASIGAIYSATFSLGGRFDHGTLQTLMRDAETLAPMLRGLGQIE